FEDIEGTGFIVVGLGSGVAATDSNWQVYGNAFYHTSSYGVAPNDEGVSGIGRIINNSVPTGWKVYNNTLADVQGTYAGFRMEAGSNSCSCYNNVYYNSVTAQNVGFTNAGNNWYYKATFTNEPGDVTGTAVPFMNNATNNFALNPSAAGTLPINKGT